MQFTRPHHVTPTIDIDADDGGLFQKAYAPSLSQDLRGGG
jgi:hypothetical protein